MECDRMEFIYNNNVLKCNTQEVFPETSVSLFNHKWKIDFENKRKRWTLFTFWTFTISLTKFDIGVPYI